MDLPDEIHLAFLTFAARGFPESPDRALARPLAPAGYDSRADWYYRQKPAEEARMRNAIAEGGRGVRYYSAGRLDVDDDSSHGAMNALPRSEAEAAETRDMLDARVAAADPGNRTAAWQRESVRRAEAAERQAEQDRAARERDRFEAAVEAKLAERGKP